MSRSYEMTVTVSGFDPKRRCDVENAIDDEAGFYDNWTDYGGDKGVRATTCDLSLTGGETEEEFSQRVAYAGMKANGKPCKIEVIATCLEDLPFERFEFGKEEFESMGVAEAVKEDEDED